MEDVEKRKDFLYYDFQGWPVFKKTLRELLKSLGAEDENGVIGFKSDSELLDIYPTSLTDDGMGYGINELCFSDADTSEDKDGNKMVIFWREACPKK